MEMDTPFPITSQAVNRHAQFQTTHWSMVLASQHQRDSQGAKWLAALCQQYWPPVYAFILHRTNSEQDAEDLTQAFFARLLERNWLASANPERGRFRAFLLTAAIRFLANEWDQKRTLKRGGGVKTVNIDTSIEMAIPDNRGVSAEALYERQWAISMLTTVLERLRSEFVEAGRAQEYELLKPWLTAAKNCTNYSDLATALGVQPVSARSAVHRLRKRFKKLFREEVSRTVPSQDEVDDELCSVIAALASPS